MTNKRLYRSRNDRKLAGVCGGLAHYFDIDPTLVRVAFAVPPLIGIGSPILVYLALMLIVPDAAVSSEQSAVEQSMAPVTV
jgi:phage shock protein PspC (stress-responsive transcriptional regulator)